MANIGQVYFIIIISMLAMVMMLLILIPSLTEIQHKQLTRDILNTTASVKNESKIDRGVGGNITSDIITDISIKIDNSTKG